MSSFLPASQPFDGGDGVEIQHFLVDANSFILKSAHRAQSGPKLVHVNTTKVFQARVHPSRTTEDQNAPNQGRGLMSNRASCNFVWLQCFLAVLVCISLLWTVWLILLTIDPNRTINRIMNTGNFDEGTFWLLVDTPASLLWPTVFGLAVVVLGYSATIIQAANLRRSGKTWKTSVRLSISSFNAVKASLGKTVVDAAADETHIELMSSAAKLVVSLAQSEHPRRKLVNIFMKAADLAIEVVLLFQILESGTPVPLVAIFTVIVVGNALSCGTMMFLPMKRTGIAEILVDVLFDFLITVGYPIIVLVYYLTTFQFDHKRFAINLEVFPAGGFEKSASVIANPMQTDIIHKSLRLLRVESVLEVLVRVGVNLLFCYRLHCVAARIQRKDGLLSSVYPKRHRASAAAMLVFVIGIIIFVGESVRTSTLACQPHPECVVKAHRWVMVQSGSSTQCPCLTLIDGNIAPKTYSEWINPTNVTDKVAQLATTGDLQTIQLINRYLPALPKEMRRCTKMTHVSLVYTHTTTMPEWAREFTKLQYLHIEGTAFSSLELLPAGMFDGMSSLIFLHLGVHPPLRQLPSFDGLVIMKSLTLAFLFSLTELPSFDSLASLERVELTSIVRIDSLPDLSHLKKLTTFAVADRASWCCNGFLGTCDLQSPLCMVHPLWGTPAASCLYVNRTEDQPTQGTLEVLSRFSFSICGGLILPGTADGPPTQAGMDQCNGTLYQQCQISGHEEAMCYNARFMGISCSMNPFPIEMRRQQIEQGIGDTCDPEIEAWLGCRL